MNFNHKKFANIMVDDVLSKLDGSHPCFERFFDLEKPRRKFILGSLSDVSKLDLGVNSSSISNNSMSVKFLLENITDNIIISPSLSIFYRVCPTLDEQMDFLENYHDKDSDAIQIAHIWKRKDIVFDDLNVEISSKNYSLDFKDIIKEITTEDEVSFNKNVLSWDCLLTEEDFKSNVLTRNVPTLGWDCSIDISLDEMFYDGKKYHLVEISMINNSEEIKSAETFLFNCNFSVFLGKNEIHPFTYEYEKNDFPSFYDSFLRSLNCHADYLEEERKIQTQNFAKFEQIKHAPKTNIDGFELTFEELSKENCIEMLEKLYNLMKGHLDSCEYSLMDQEHSTAILSFKTSLSRFNDGIEILKSNSNALKAFNLMNKAFFNNAKGKYSSWRIFQIVFIVSNLYDVVNKTNTDLCELLHVMTGGGKSETYFGLVIFSAFYDRIVGKLFGVTALTKFPLRMLSIQQLRRIADLFIWAEEIRLEEGIQGEPFSVAYFVGNSDEFPRYNIDIKNDIFKASKKGIKIDGVIIDECPICGGHVYLSYDSSRELILHECNECNRSFGLYFTDEEIFRMIPTFIVSTVDKLAGVSQQRRFKNILGGKLDLCLEGHGFIPRGDVCEANNKQCKSHGEPLNIDFDTGPSLIIQDEMHLIKEGFGTIDSHFESLLENLHYKFSGNKFKNISMSATVNGAKNQIENLYHKSLLVFPVNLENKNGKDFFFEK